MASRIIGGERLGRAYLALPKRLRRKVNRQAVAAGARVGVKAAKAAAPRAAVSGGTLKRSIRAVRDKRSRGGRIVRYNIGPTRGGFYGKFLELGTRYLPARPWLEPAVLRKRKEIVRKIGQIWGRGVEREFFRLAGPPQRRR